jgi:hypothetical protein
MAVWLLSFALRIAIARVNLAAFALLLVGLLLPSLPLWILSKESEPLQGHIELTQNLKRNSLRNWNASALPEACPVIELRQLGDTVSTNSRDKTSAERVALAVPERRNSLPSASSPEKSGAVEPKQDPV